MKTLQELVKENRDSKKRIKFPREILSTQIKNYELFSDEELKEYFNSERFEQQLKKCQEPYFLLEEEGCFQFFLLKSGDNGIDIVLDGIFVPD